MIETFIKEAEHIYIASGITDFRKQMDTLCAMVIDKFNLETAVTGTMNLKNQHVELGQFLNDGRIPLTTNLVERAIRPFAVHRRAWLFADTPAGAVCNAVMYSLVESAGIAGINNLNIFKYIEYLLTVLPQLDNLNDEKQLKQYLPWAESLPASVRSSVSEVLKVNKGLLVINNRII